MSLFKQRKKEKETLVTKKNGTKDTPEVAPDATPGTTPEESTNEENTDAEKIAEEKALVAITSNLPEKVAKSVLRLMSVMNPDKRGFEEMGGAHWSPPIVKIRQGLTSEAPENCKLGEMFTEKGDVFDRLEFLPLYMYKTRAKFEEDNPNPVCRSDNAVTNTYGQPCAECPDAPFKDGAKTKCAESINVLAFDKDFSEIYHIQFQRTSYRAGFKLFRQAGATESMWDRWFALKTEERTRQQSKTKYSVFTVTTTGEKLEDIFAPLAEKFYQRIHASRQEILARVTERAETGKRLVDEIDGKQFDGEAAADAPEPDFSDGGM